MSRNDESGEAIGSQESSEGARPDPVIDAVRRRVLVIDDDDGIRRVLRRSLAAYEVVTAGDGRRALAILATGTDFDLVLCDVVMPGMGGVEFWSEVGAAHPSLLDRFVFMTGGAQTAQDEQFLASGVVEVLRKPFSSDALRRLVASRIDERR